MRFDAWTFACRRSTSWCWLWLLHRFLYRPVLGIIAARKAAADKVIAEAEAEKASAEALRQDLQRQKAALAEARQAELSKARDAAEAERAESWPRRARRPTRPGRPPARRWSASAPRRCAIWRATPSALGVSIARRLLDEASAAAVQAPCIERICADLAPCRPSPPPDRRVPRSPSAAAQVASPPPRSTSRRARPAGAPVRSAGLRP